MIKNPGNYLSGIEWHCCCCGAINKVADAKFCGKCGCARKVDLSQPVLKAEKHINSDSKTIKGIRLKLFKELKSFIYPTKKRLYKTVIASAILLLVASIISGYKLYTNVNAIHITQTRFTDVAIDHPVYSVCKNLLEIDAISFRKNIELAPYENISASEWNHVLNQASKYLNKKYSKSAYFSEKDAVSVENINNKLRALKANCSELTDTSRIQSFYILEQTLFN